MTNHIEAVRSLARKIAQGGVSEVLLGIFRVYLAAAGASVRGSWVYIPGRATPLKGFRAAAEYVATLTETSAFLRSFANVHDLVEREAGRPPEGLAGTPLRTADMTSVQPTADDLNEVAKHVSELASQLSALASTPPPVPAANEVHIGHSVPLGTLRLSSHAITDHIVRRTAYDTGKALLETLDGWIEGARENTAAGMGPRNADPEQFHASDIRAMVNDAMRLMGAPEHRLPQRGEQ